MDEKKVLDLDVIATECKITDNVGSDVMLENIQSLQCKYDEKHLTTIYNHFLKICKDQDTLMYLIKELDKNRDKTSLSAIIDLLMDLNNPDNLRSMCAKAIANYKDTSAVPSLLYCLNNKNENYKVRLACADALCRVGDKYAVTPLINIAQDEEEKSVYVRESAIVALGMLGDMRAIDPLVSILETKKGFIDKFTFLKEKAIEVLGKFNFSNDRVIKALGHSLTDESAQIRINAIEALMESEDEKAYSMIKEMLDDLDEEVQKNALIALYNIGGRKILDEVIAEKKYNQFLKEEAQNMINEYEEEAD
jgi:HEAT repeat protein